MRCVSPTASSGPKDAVQYVKKEKCTAHVDIAIKLTKRKALMFSHFHCFLRYIWKALSSQFCGSRDVPLQDIHPTWSAQSCL